MLLRGYTDESQGTIELVVQNMSPLIIGSYFLLQRDLGKKVVQSPKYLFASFVLLFTLTSSVQYCLFNQKTYADGLFGRL